VYTFPSFWIGEVGIDLSNINDVTIKDLLIQGAYYYGIRMMVSSDITILGNTITGNNFGIYISNSTRNTILGNTIKNNGVGINVEHLAEFSDSQMQTVRFWMGEGGTNNQTALRVDGSMYQTLLFGVVFESFTPDPNDIFAIDLGETCNPAPILDGGVSFLGSWTARVHNPFGVWVSGVGSVFERSATIPVGINGQFGENKSIESRPLTIFSFKPKIEVSGSFSHNETLTVRVRIEYIDNVVSSSVSRTFTSNSAVWFTDDEMMRLLPSQSIVWAILVDAKVNVGSSDASVKVSGYGTAG